MCAGGAVYVYTDMYICPYINYESADRSSGEQFELIPPPQANP